MKFTYGTSTYLTCGDIYQNKELELIDQYGEALAADVIKANHHGTHTSNYAEWLTAISPLAMFAPADDIGGTPLAKLAAELGIAYYSVGLDGLVMFKMGDSRNYEVISRYDSSLRANYTGTFGMAAGEDNDPDPDPGTDPNPTPDPDPEESGDNKGDNKGDNGGNVKTGDETRAGMWLCLCLLALAGGAVLLRNKIKMLRNKTIS